MLTDFDLKCLQLLGDGHVDIAIIKQMFKDFDGIDVLDNDIHNELVQVGWLEDGTSVFV